MDFAQLIILLETIAGFGDFFTGFGDTLTGSGNMMSGSGNMMSGSGDMLGGSAELATALGKSVVRGLLESAGSVAIG